MEAYCFRCRTKREMNEPVPVIMMNKKPAVQGLCSVCGTRMYRIGKQAFHSLETVPEDRVFRCADGRAIKNLDELISALKNMPEETFAHHVTADKNDFSNWVKYVIGDEALAIALSKENSPLQAAKSMEGRIFGTGKT